jgi:hypothetical protein
MKTPVFLAIALAMSVTAFAQTSPPAAPTLTAGAEFKGLRLDWDSVPGATWYQLEYRAHQTGSFVKQGNDFPATATSTRFSFPLHLYDWTYARYRLAACNSAGCSRSAEVSVSDLRRDAVGYFKAAAPVQGGSLGHEIDLAPDGYTVAATAPGENEYVTATHRYTGGAVYVFRRGSDGKWLQRARIDAHGSSMYPDDLQLDVAVSASGNTVAVALPTEYVDGTKRGQVDVYFLKNNAYGRTRIARPDMDKISSVQLSENGYVLAVNGSLANVSTTAIYKSTNGVWVNTRTISTGEACTHVTMTRDSKALAAMCQQAEPSGAPRDYIRVLSGSNFATRAEMDVDHDIGDNDRIFHYHFGFAVDRTGDTVAVSSATEYQGSTSSGRVDVFHREAGVYQEVAGFVAGDWNGGDEADTVNFGYSISLSGDGHTMAVGQLDDNGRGFGPRAAPLLAGTTRIGAFYVYRLTDSWKLANMVKPNYYDAANSDFEFGWTSALSDTGKTLVVGAPLEDSSAKGIDGNWADASLSASGALFMY